MPADDAAGAGRGWVRRGWRFTPTAHPLHGFGRLGALIDGIYAIAATLLVLELRLPEPLPAGGLGTALVELWPSYAAYAFGFLQMVSGWLQTRRLESWLRGVDHYLTLLILAGLAIYALTPFTTSVLAHSVAHEARTVDVTSAVRLLGIVVLTATALWSLTLLYCRVAGLLRADLDPETFLLYCRLNGLAWLAPAAALVLSLWSPWASLGVLVVSFVFALLPLEAHPAQLGHPVLRSRPGSSSRDLPGPRTDQPVGPGPDRDRT